MMIVRTLGITGIPKATRKEEPIDQLVLRDPHILRVPRVLAIQSNFTNSVGRSAGDES